MENMNLLGDYSFFAVGWIFKLIFWIAFLFFQAGVIVWVLHTFSGDKNYRGRALIMRVVWYSFCSDLLAALFLTLIIAAVFLGVVMITNGTPNELPSFLPSVYSTSFLYVLIVSLLQIKFIPLPQHMSKNRFVLILFSITLAMVAIRYVISPLWDSLYTLMGF